MLLASFPKFCWLYLDHPGVARCSILGISMDFKHHHYSWTSYRIVVGWDDISLPLSSLHSGLKPVCKDQPDIFWYFPSQNTQINFIVMSYGGKLLFPKGSAPIFDDWFWSPQRDDSRILCFPRFSTEGSGSNQLQTEWNNFSNQNHSEPRIERTKTSGRSTKS